MNRLSIQKLVFWGEGRDPASIDFKPGFNVISGPSDTGKSMIFECIKYVLGSSELPKEPPEAKGYTNIFLTLKTGEDFFTIERSILSSDVKIYETDYEGITEDAEAKVLAPGGRGKENLSNYLLDHIGISNKKLKKNQSNETVTLTFNILRNLILIDEIKIQTKSSPIYSGNVIDETRDKALFRFLLKNIDYNNIVAIPKPQVRKADANARIEILSQFIDRNSSLLDKDTSKEELKEQLEKLEKSIEYEITKSTETTARLKNLQESRKESWEAALKAESKIDSQKEIRSRFHLLQKYYATDLERLDAIIETGDFLSIETSTNCPVCGAEPTHHKPECVISDAEIADVKRSCVIEKNKIQSLQDDLAKTIKQVDDDIEDNINLKKQKQIEYKKIDAEISMALQPSLEKLKKDLRRLFDKRREIELMLNYYDQVKEMEELKTVAEANLKAPPKQDKIPTGVKTAEASDFLKVIEDRLKAWSFPGFDRIGFSEDNQDITLGNKNRGDQGKGFRAITYAAFIISILDYCIEEKMPHPGFVILDSPLVTFRDKENPFDALEDLPENTKDQFYKNLSTLDHDRQIIVIENDPPPEGAVKRMNYIKFTKEVANGRYGFIPL